MGREREGGCNIHGVRFAFGKAAWANSGRRVPILNMNGSCAFELKRTRAASGLPEDRDEISVVPIAELARDRWMGVVIRCPDFDRGDNFEIEVGDGVACSQPDRLPIPIIDNEDEFIVQAVQRQRESVILVGEVVRSVKEVNVETAKGLKIHAPEIPR